MALLHSDGVALTLLLLFLAFLLQGISDFGYNTIGLIVFVPCIVLPMIFVPTGERKVVWHRRYTFKANVWIAIFSFIGNYFWTHYFFALLGAKYTFPISTRSEFNKVPIVCYLLTQAYFHTYHVITNMLLRIIRRRIETLSTILRTAVYGIAIIVISIFWAYLETKTIESFPYYSFADRDRMYQIGLTFYAIYFIVSFPMFIRLDERDSKDTWDWARSAIDSLAACMIVFVRFLFFPSPSTKIEPKWSDHLGNNSLETSQLFFFFGSPPSPFNHPL